jgi:hypothetical protein
MYIPIVSNGSSISTGSYKVTYKIKEDAPDSLFSSLPIFSTPKEISMLGKTVKLVKTELQQEKGLYHIYVDVLSNPIPLVYFATAIIFTLGLGITYLIFDKIYALVDDSKVFISFSLVVIFGYLILRLIKKNK